MGDVNFVVCLLGKSVYPLDLELLENGLKSNTGKGDEESAHCLLPAFLQRDAGLHFQNTDVYKGAK
ncbi:hypothetical protein HAX54_005137, partial [Datura stramonium]|nr:hypothetical protein [Datura stramonium]